MRLCRVIFIDETLYLFNFFRDVAIFHIPTSMMNSNENGDALNTYFDPLTRSE